MRSLMWHDDQHMVCQCLAATTNITNLSPYVGQTGYLSGYTCKEVMKYMKTLLQGSTSCYYLSLRKDSAGAQQLCRKLDLLGPGRGSPPGARRRWEASYLRRVLG